MANSNTGLFTATYDITTGLAGAPLLRLALAVNTARKTVGGTAEVSQATDPPLEVQSVVHGEFTYMTVVSKISHILVTARGLVQERGITPLSVPNLVVRAVLDEDWQGGTASFGYLDGARWVDIEKAKVTKAVSNPIVALYGAAITDAVASGDIARMKQVAAQAEQQLAQVAGIQTALAAVKAEIAKAGAT